MTERKLQRVKKALSGLIADTDDDAKRKAFETALSIVSYAENFPENDNVSLASQSTEASSSGDSSPGSSSVSSWSDDAASDVPSKGRGKGKGKSKR